MTALRAGHVPALGRRRRVESTCPLLARSDHPRPGAGWWCSTRWSTTPTARAGTCCARGRAGPGDRPRGDLRRRGQAPHAAVAVARRAARRPSTSTVLERLDDELGRGSTARWHRQLRGLLTDREVNRTRLRVRRLLRAGTSRCRAGLAARALAAVLTVPRTRRIGSPTCSRGPPLPVLHCPVRAIRCGCTTPLRPGRARPLRATRRGCTSAASRPTTPPTWATPTPTSPSTWWHRAWLRCGPRRRLRAERHRRRRPAARAGRRDGRGLGGARGP